MLDLIDLVVVEEFKNKYYLSDEDLCDLEVIELFLD